MNFMKRLLGLLSFASLVFVLACARPQASNNSVATDTPVPAVAPAQSAAPQEEAPRISLADAKQAFDNGKAIFIDARAEDTYKAEHIKGAINITFDTLDKQLKHLPKDKTLIAYCS